MASNKILQSSANPNKWSLTFKGILVSLIPLAIAFASMKGVALTETELVQLVDVVTMVGSSIAIGIGLARKIYYKFK